MSQANKHHRTHDMDVGDQVWVSSAHLALPGGLTRKLAPKFVGPFLVQSKVNDVAFRVALPAKYSRLHNVFHVSQLKKFTAGAPSQMSGQRPEPEFVDQEFEYQVEDIIDVRVVRGKR